MNYNEWCDLHGMNHENDNNYELYVSWLKREYDKWSEVQQAKYVRGLEMEQAKLERQQAK